MSFFPSMSLSSFFPEIFDRFLLFGVLSGGEIGEAFKCSRDSLCPFPGPSSCSFPSQPSPRGGGGGGEGLGFCCASLAPSSRGSSLHGSSLSRGFRCFKSQCSFLLLGNPTSEPTVGLRGF